MTTRQLSAGLGNWRVTFTMKISIHKRAISDMEMRSRKRWTPVSFWVNSTMDRFVLNRNHTVFLISICLYMFIWSRDNEHPNHLTLFSQSFHRNIQAWSIQKKMVSCSKFTTLKMFFNTFAFFISTGPSWNHHQTCHWTPSATHLLRWSSFPFLCFHNPAWSGAKTGSAGFAHPTRCNSCDRLQRESPETTAFRNREPPANKPWRSLPWLSVVLSFPEWKNLSGMEKPVLFQGSSKGFFNASLRWIHEGLPNRLLVAKRCPAKIAKCCNIANMFFRRQLRTSKPSLVAFRSLILHGLDYELNSKCSHVVFSKPKFTEMEKKNVQIKFNIEKKEKLLFCSDLKKKKGNNSGRCGNCFKQSADAMPITRGTSKKCLNLGSQSKA